MEKNTEENRVSQAQDIKRSVLVSFKAGCLTFVVAAIAILVGLLLDTRMDTFPRWTLILLIGSAPITLAGVFLMVRRALKRGKQHADENEKVPCDNDLSDQ
jgi:ABC-type nickel/cobalt efflux system permease component RcnA